jgi:hypothetical protein
MCRPPPITDHAVKRYCERIIGVAGPTRKEDIEAIKAKLWTTGLAAALTSGVKRVQTDGMVFIFHEGVVITIYSEGMNGRAERRRGKGRPRKKRRINTKRFGRKKGAR